MCISFLHLSAYNKKTFYKTQMGNKGGKHHLSRDEIVIESGEMPLSDFTKSLVISVGEWSVPERANLNCLRPKAEFANSSDNRALDWSEISFTKRKGFLLTLSITELVMLP